MKCCRFHSLAPYGGLYITHPEIHPIHTLKAHSAISVFDVLFQKCEQLLCEKAGWGNAIFSRFPFLADFHSGRISIAGWYTVGGRSETRKTLPDVGAQRNSRAKMFSTLTVHNTYTPSAQRIATRPKYSVHSRYALYTALFEDCEDYLIEPHRSHRTQFSMHSRTVFSKL